MNTLACMTCGALVFETDMATHAQFHRALRSALQAVADGFETRNHQQTFATRIIQALKKMRS